jgi:hypothetical protein
VIRKTDAERWYEKWLPEMPNTAEGNWIMAEECRKRGLARQRDFHREEVLKHDPDHAAARRALGYSKIDGSWVKTEDWWTSRGYVRHEGAWRLRPEVELETAASRREQETNQWKRQLKLWRSWILRRRGDEREALQKIRSIRSPLAAPALADLLENDEEPVRLKLLYIDVLASLRSARATSAFVNRVLLDRDENVRDRCLDQLVARDTKRAVALLAGTLRHQENKMVNRAAEALGRLKHPDAIPPLIDALFTKHRFSTKGGGMDIGFTPEGGGGMSLGGRPKIVEIERPNPQVLASLVSLTGANLGYNREEWKRWYVEENTPSGVNLRRRG